MAASGALSALDCSLLSPDVQALRSFVLGWMNSVILGPEGAGASGADMLRDLGGPRNCLRDGMVLASLWAKLHPEAPPIALEAAENEMMEKANLWVVLPVIEAGGVAPVVPSHAWDASSIHDGDQLANLYLGLALAAHAGVVLPRDVYAFQDNEAGAEPEPLALTPMTVTEPRGVPTLIAKVLVDGKDCGQNVIVRASPVLVGRFDDEDPDDSDGDVLIADGSVSSEHCTIWYDGTKFMAKDEGSTHGTLVAQPWSRALVNLGSRDAETGKTTALWRGSELYLGDSQLVVMAVESTHYYSDYPLLASPPGLNLDIVNGATFMGMTTMGVHYPGTSFGACLEADVPEDVAALKLAHATVDDLESLHATFYFSSLLGRYIFTNYAAVPCAVAPPSGSPAGASWIPVQRGSFAFVDHGMQVKLGDVFVFAVSVIPADA
ncbi:uncharacterized protein AMSG_03958 [Thecamonas trahens ATCC 50062]|uniref:FHA domain-containing protein n=1 Tax=Thecamonas trahens ATCC 50062 TaxID=461836 RepID=A0A0L0D6M6_THETB|nr:hypothetical protein AMSG_03958 [Thecamonas trahens ATCC 50062]KNC47731.1 hypothetical protein AMSG_03958 [Thecamonas trahens ATCC 50062]|eukprot:XP_013759209.1 hypothetical protein AMSG_03958 [Thecamonas trahens ATCC 50062]